MASRVFTHAFTVGASPADVVAHLADPENYLGLSPLIVAVRDVHPVAGRAGVTGYTAVERFTVAGLHYDNLIAVTLGADDPAPGAVSHRHQRIVSGDVVSPGGVQLSYRYTIEPAAATDTASRVTDTITVHAPFGLLRFASGQARSVQLSRAVILAQRLGDGA